MNLRPLHPSSRPPRAPLPPRLLRRGYTLIETALATVIVGTAVLSMVQLMVVCTRNNQAGSDMSTAMYLATNLQEAMADLPFNDPSGAGFGREEADQILAWDDIDDFHNFDSGSTQSALPVDSTRLPIPGLDRFAQLVTVSEVNLNNLTVSLPGSDAKQVTVRIVFRNQNGEPEQELYRTTWVAVRN